MSQHAILVLEELKKYLVLFHTELKDIKQNGGINLEFYLNIIDSIHQHQFSYYFKEQMIIDFVDYKMFDFEHHHVALNHMFVRELNRANTSINYLKKGMELNNPIHEQKEYYARAHKHVFQQITTLPILVKQLMWSDEKETEQQFEIWMHLSPMDEQSSTTSSTTLPELASKHICVKDVIGFTYVSMDHVAKIMTKEINAQLQSLGYSQLTSNTVLLPKKYQTTPYPRTKFGVSHLLIKDQNGIKIQDSEGLDAVIIIIPQGTLYIDDLHL